MTKLSDLRPSIIGDDRPQAGQARRMTPKRKSIRCKTAAVIETSSPIPMSEHQHSVL